MNNFSQTKDKYSPIIVRSVLLIVKSISNNFNQYTIECFAMKIPWYNHQQLDPNSNVISFKLPLFLKIKSSGLKYYIKLHKHDKQTETNIYKNVHNRRNRRRTVS